MTTLSLTAPARPAIDLGPPRLIRAIPGPGLFAHLHDDPGYGAHRRRSGLMPRLGLAALTSLLDAAAIRGRGGAGFPFAVKLRAAAAARRRPIVVVNAAEGEPWSAKDSALGLFAPHLVLDAAAMTAAALGAHTAHVVVPAERPSVAAAWEQAVAERSGDPVRWRTTRTAGGFVSGQARAVVELLSGRPNLPVTAWAPEAVDGVGGRPTLLSNAETWAQLALLVGAGPSSYASLGTPDEPGTTLLTLPGTGDGEAVVVEARHGEAWESILRRTGVEEQALLGPVLMGGFHGTWLRPGALIGGVVSRTAWPLGAGVVRPLPPGQCPVAVTAALTARLAAESAGRCGPCRNGLPALAQALAEPLDAPRAEGLVRAVDRRGACAHPDGTARLVRTLMDAYGHEVALHAHGRCSA